MSTDRELLELAAEAAGYGPPRWSELDGRWVAGIDGAAKPWNPLTDDGDALRLAVKLRITILWSATVDDFSPSMEVYGADDIHSEYIEVKTGDDPYAEARRAIVRAAAGIAKAAKEKS